MEEKHPQTLVLHERVGDAVVGTANFGPRYAAVEVGKLPVLLRKTEDLEGMARAGWLDPTNPVEVNLTYARKFGKKLDTIKLTRKDSWLEADELIRKRPAIGYIPAELLTRPYGAGMKALTESGDVAAQVAAIRLHGQNPDEKVYAKDLSTDGEFWQGIAASKLYEPWLREIIGHSNDLGVNLLAPPVPVISPDLRSSPRLQMNLNMAVNRRWADPMNPDVPHGLLSTRDLRLLYSLHVHPSALDDPELIEQSIRGMQGAIEDPNSRFWGVHLHFPDWERFINQSERVQRAKALMARVATYATSRGIFVWVSDAAPAGLTFLDLGASFVSYHPGVRPCRAFVEGGGGGDKSTMCGQMLDLWNYGLVRRKAIEDNDWKLPPTGYLPEKVPLELRDASPGVFRKEIQKPNNIAVQQTLTDQRLKELRESGDHHPSERIISQSADDRFNVWSIRN